jgi:tetratricopeptide (TPR) repeat protein
MRLLVAGTVLCIIGVLAPTGARAASAEKEARALFQRAEMSFNLGKFPEALADYQAAYEAKPLPGFLFNIAQCYRKLGQDVEALDYYRNYVRRFPTSPNRAEVDRRIQEIEREQEAKPHPTNPPPNNDQKPDARSGGTITPISPPPPNGNSTGGQTNLAPPPPPPDSSTTLVATAPSPAEESPAIYKRWWFWAGVGVVVAAGAAVGIAVATRGQVGDCRGITPCRTVGE